MNFILKLFALFIIFSTSASAEIIISTVGPMSGPYASIGAQMKQGAAMAVKHINAQGGVLGQQLVLDVQDDVCDPKQATSIANNLASRDIKFVAGHFCSSASMPASTIYAEEGIIMMTPASTAPNLTERGLDNIFRLCGRDDQQGAVAAEYIARKFPNANIAILNDKTAYGKGLADQTKANLNKAGKQEVMYETITPGERDFNALITRMKARGVDIIYLGGYHTEAGLLVRQAADQNLKARLFSGDALITEEFWDITGKTGTGTLITFSPDPRLNPAAEPIVADFKKISFKPEGYTLYNYGVVQTFAQAIEKAGSTNTKDVIKALKSSTFDTIRGEVSFNSKGDIEAPGYVVYEWNNGDYKYVDDTP